jgi:hypothetical protein
MEGCIVSENSAIAVCIIALVIAGPFVVIGVSLESYFKHQERMAIIACKTPVSN